MNEEDLRDCFAMFAMNGLLSRASVFDAKEVWEIADAMLEARSQSDEEGIAVKMSPNEDSNQTNEDKEDSAGKEVSKNERCMN